MLPMPDSPDFPLVLRNRRMELHLTFRALNMLTGFAVRQLMKYESGNPDFVSKPKPRSWIKLNEVLGYELDEDLIQEYFELRPQLGDYRKVVHTKHVDGDAKVKQTFWFPT